MTKESVCKYCGKPIWKDEYGWNHKEYPVAPPPHHFPEPKLGHTLAEIVNLSRLFKRPMHANHYGFLLRNPELREFVSQPDGYCLMMLPRLTAEDLTADDWEEVV